MPVYLSPSQLASQQAAASLLVDDDGTPYHDSRPIERLPLDVDVAMVFGPGKLVRGAANPPGVCSPLSPAAEEGLFHETGEDTTWMEVDQSTRSPQSTSHSGTHASNHASHHGTRLGGASRTDSGGPQHLCTQRAHCTRTADQRHLERLAQPRGERDTTKRHMKPNYGRLLNFAEEEERNRQREQQRRRKSPSPSRDSITPCAETAQSTWAQISPSLTESEQHVLPAATAMPATQMAWYDNLAAPKKVSPVPVADSDTPPRRTSSGAAAPRRGDSNTFDRLAAPKKPAVPSFDESMPSPHWQARRHSWSPRVSTQLQLPEQQDLYLKGLAEVKERSAPSHCLPHAPAGHDTYTTKKPYYGGTTVISAPPSQTCPATLPPPPPLAGGRCSGRVPSASWEDLANMSERRALTPGLCTECGTARPQQAYTVSSQTVPTGAAAGCENTAAKRATLLPKRSSPAPSANGDGPTLVQSTPAKVTGSKPPIVVRTRRHVPPSDEQGSKASGQPASDLAMDESPATVAPEPVEAMRRRFATPTVPVEMDTMPASSKQETADITPIETPARATPTSDEVQAFRPASLTPPPPPLPRPVEITAQPAVVQATKRVSSAPAIAASASAPRKPVALKDSNRQISAPCSVPVASESSDLESPLQRLQATSPRTQTFSPSLISSSAPASDKLVTGAPPEVTSAEENDAVADTSVSAIEDVYVIPPSPVSGKKGSRKIMHRKPHKDEQEVLQDADFACQLEVFSPESHRPITIERKPKAVPKTKVLKAVPPKKSARRSEVGAGERARGEG